MALEEELGRLNIKVSMDDSELAKKVDNVDRSISKNAKSFSQFSRSVRGGSQEIAVHAAKMGMLKNSISGMTDRVGALSKVMNNEAKMSKYSAEEQDRIRGKYAQSQAQLSAYKNEFTSTAKAMAEMQVKTTGVSGALYSAGQKMSTVGGKLTRNVTLPLGAIGALAIKTGMDFEAGMSRVQAIAGASKSELEQLTAQARQLGKSTAFSASEVAQGMENMASAGFNTNEIMKAMPGMLDLAAVSGGDVAASAETAASSLRAFNLDASQSGHVADVFAKAAADTNAETQDMGEAMKYAAPVAHQLGMSIEETAAAIGIMSDNGIKGSQAGTTLRGALTRLAKPTMAMTDTMNEYGLSFFDAQGKMKPFGTILSDLKGKIGGLSEEQRASALTTLFGKEALSGMMSLVGTTPGKYNKLTESLKNSDGAAEKMAKTMQDNAKNAIEQMMGSLEDAAISIEKAVAPSIRDIADFVGKVADAFTDLDPAAQKMIINMGLMAVAAGPLLSILGKVTTGAIELQASFAGVRAGRGAATAIQNVGNESKGAAGGMRVLGAASGMVTNALTALGPVGLGVLGTTVLLGVGVGLLAKHFKEENYANRWGDGISKSASNALDGMQKAQQGISDSLVTTGNDSSKSSKEVSDAFGTMATKVQEAAEKTKKALNKSMAGLPEDVRALLEKSSKEYTEANDKRVKEAQDLADKVAAIEKNNSKLSIDQQNYVANAREKMNELAVKSLGLTASQEKQALTNLNGDINEMSASSRSKAIKSVGDTVSQLDSKFEKSKASLKTMFDSGVISADQYNAAIKQLGSEHAKQIDPMIARMYALEKANGATDAEMQLMFGNLGVTLDQAKTAYDKYGKAAEDNGNTVIKSTSMMSDKAKEAVKTWNSIVFDEKTGKVKTNAKEEVQTAITSGGKWHELKLAAKNAPVNSNARQIFNDAAMEAGKWDSLTVNEKKALVNSNVGATLATSSKYVNDFNSLPINAKEAVVNSNSPQVIMKSLQDIGQWNTLPIAMKNAILNSNAGNIVDNAKIKMSEWNTLTPTEQKLISVDTSSATVQKAITKQSEWNALNPDVKRLLSNNSDALQKLRDAGINLGKYNNISPDVKKLFGDSSDVINKSNQGKGAINSFNGTNPKTQGLKADWQGQGAVDTANSRIKGIPDSKTSTIFTKFVESHEKRATGDANWKGGTVTVNDQQGDMYREMIKTPSGHTFVPQGRNQTMNLPKGTQIFNAAATARLMNSTVGTKRLQRLSNLDTNQSMMSSKVQSTAGSDNMANAGFNEMISLLKVIASKDMNVMLDKRSIVDTANQGMGRLTDYKERGITI